MKAIAKTKVLFAIVPIFVLGVFLLLRQGSKKPLDYEKPVSSNQEKHAAVISANDTSLVHMQECKVELVELAEKKPSQTVSTLDTLPPLTTTNAEILIDVFDDLLEDLPLAGVSRRTGNITDLYPDEETKAIELWDREAKKWSQLKEFSGDIDIIYLINPGKEEEKEVSLYATIHMRVNEIDTDRVDWKHSKYPPSYEMTITGKNNKWKFVYDGMKNDSKLICEYKALAAQLKPFLHREIASEIWEPSNLFLHPGNQKNPVDPRTTHFYEHHQPQRHPNTVKPDSYMFAPSFGSRAQNIYYFEGGHLSSAVYGPPENPRYKSFYEAYEEIDGFDFPTNITSDSGSWKRTLRFSNIKIDSLLKE